MQTIGSLGRRTGTKVQISPYYELIDLILDPGRSDGGQRRYVDAELDRLSFIRHARQLEGSARKPPPPRPTGRNSFARPIRNI